MSEQPTPEQMQQLQKKVVSLMKKVEAELSEFDIIAMPWYDKDRYGWPIEYTKGRPIQNFVRMIIFNLSKLTP